MEERTMKQTKVVLTAVRSLLLKQHEAIYKGLGNINLLEEFVDCGGMKSGDEVLDEVELLLTRLSEGSGALQGKECLT